MRPTAKSWNDASQLRKLGDELEQAWLASRGASAAAEPSVAPIEAVLTSLRQQQAILEANIEQEIAKKDLCELKAGRLKRQLHEASALHVLQFCSYCQYNSSC